MKSRLIYCVNLCGLDPLWPNGLYIARKGKNALHRIGFWGETARNLLSTLTLDERPLYRQKGRITGGAYVSEWRVAMWEKEKGLRPGTDTRLQLVFLMWTGSGRDNRARGSSPPLRVAVGSLAVKRVATAKAC